MYPQDTGTHACQLHSCCAARLAHPPQIHFPTSLVSPPIFIRAFTFDSECEQGPDSQPRTSGRADAITLGVENIRCRKFKYGIALSLTYFDLAAR